MEQQVQDSLPVSEYCRLCLSSSGDKLEIFGNQGREEDIVNIIALLFNCQIVQDDSWPQNICVECFEKVKEYHGFFSIVRSTETSLEKILGPVSLPDIKIPFKKTEFPFENEFKMKIEVPDENPDTLAATDEESPTGITEKPPQRKRIRKRDRRCPSKQKQNDALIRKYANLTCDLCKTTLGSFGEFREHYAVTHNTLGHVTCCDLIFKERQRLLEHIQHHENPSSLQCETCGKKCKSKKTLDSHKTTHIPPDQRPFKCDQCPKSFMKISVFKEHQNIHGDRPYKCDQCGKTFASKIVLYSHTQVVHERKHTKICEICAQVFVSKDGFEAHKIKHMEKKPPKLECAMCGKKFQQRSGILRHMLMMHKSGKQLFQCDQCGKKANNRRTLYNHVLSVHRTDQKYQCHLCEKSFKKSLNLKVSYKENTEFF
ncbi:hypothetical protein DMENIID0001_170970 [Sergentomyia squamirostris]